MENEPNISLGGTKILLTLLSSLRKNNIFGANTFWEYWRFIKVQCDGDDDNDGNVTVSDERLSFESKYDDDNDVRRYWFKDYGVMTVNATAPWCPAMNNVIFTQGCSVSYYGIIYK